MQRTDDRCKIDSGNAPTLSCKVVSPACPPRRATGAPLVADQRGRAPTGTDAGADSPRTRHLSPIDPGRESRMPAAWRAPFVQTPRVEHIRVRPASPLVGPQSGPGRARPRPGSPRPRGTP